MNQRIIKITVVPTNEPIFSELATEVSIEDESGGEFVVVEQHGNGLGKVQFNSEEWPAVRKAINRMVRLCRPEVKQ